MPAEDGYVVLTSGLGNMSVQINRFSSKKVSQLNMAAAKMLQKRHHDPWKNYLWGIRLSNPDSELLSDLQ